MNPFISALRRIERYIFFKNRLPPDSQGTADALQLRNEAIAFLIREGLMDQSGSMLSPFSTSSDNPLIAEAAIYAIEVFAGRGLLE